MKRWFLMLCVGLMAAGCMEKGESLSDNAKIAKHYLEDAGYDVVRLEQESEIQFSSYDVKSLHGEQIWAVQTVDPEPYLQQKIDTVKFSIQNHPLDNVFNMGKTEATIFIINGEVIGGYSYPIAEMGVDGAPYSLDGKTAEEMERKDNK